MKVLWFANTPCNADDNLNTQLKGTGGWLKSLDIDLQDKIDLHIAFYSDEKKETFKYKESTYYPIIAKKNLLEKIIDKINNSIIREEHLDQYLDIIREVKPDIIHIHGTENPFGCIINRINIPVVISIQGILSVITKKYFIGIEKKFTINKLSFLNPNLLLNNQNRSYKKFIKMAKHEAKTLLNAKHIIGRTSWDQNVTRILSPDSVYYHNDEMLRDSFYKNTWQPHNRSNKILFTTSGPNIYKGLETICEAIYLLNKIDFDFEWRIAGLTSDNNIIKFVKKKLGHKFPNKGIKFLGNLNENELVSNLLLADLYVMPSHIENSANSLCEAMIIGMPIISSFVGGTGTLLKDQESGILIQDGDPLNLAGAIFNNLKHNKRIIEYGKKAREMALKKHNKDEIIHTLLSIYNKIINE